MCGIKGGGDEARVDGGCDQLFQRTCGGEVECCEEMFVGQAAM